MRRSSLWGLVLILLSVAGIAWLALSVRLLRDLPVVSRPSPAPVQLLPEQPADYSADDPGWSVTGFRLDLLEEQLDPATAARLRDRLLTPVPTVTPVGTTGDVMP